MRRARWLASPLTWVWMYNDMLENYGTIPPGIFRKVKLIQPQPYPLRWGTLSRFGGFLAALLWAIFRSMPGIAVAEPTQDRFAPLADEYLRQTRPLLQQFCLNCHSKANQAGDLDLERFATLDEVRRGTKVWL